MKPDQWSSYAGPGAERRRLVLVRVCVVVALLLGLNYVVWRWFFSINWAAWWISVPLVITETYSLIDLGFFAMTVWRSRQRGNPPVPVGQPSVDVFITTYNEPVGLVEQTARAAVRIRHPHRTWILDDGDRPELGAIAGRLGVGYITRGEEWNGKPRHAKAGNLNNALLQTSGDFILVLDADMVPHPQILDRTLGYFADEKVALVQTPQYFTNVPDDDPLGSQAPLFYGPIQEGKDGWGAAFFCGSNAVVRREALMQLGIVGYVTATERSVLTGLRAAQGMVRRALRRGGAESEQLALAATSSAITAALRAIGNGEPLGEVTYSLQTRIAEFSRAAVEKDLAQIAADLEQLGVGVAHEDRAESHTAVAQLAGPELSPLNALDAVQATLRALDLGRSEEAQALLPMATISVTEDMATSMRLHAAGWKSVYHNEILAEGLAPEGLAAALTQRLRWAQGTVQVLLKENPLFLPGLTLPQRLMYFSTMWTYLSGFATVVYLVAPTLFLTAGVLPVSSYAEPFFWRFLPFMVANQLLFLVAARGLPTWRGQQYTIALFPLWIRACFSAAANVFARRPLGFAVTPKSGTRSTGLDLSPIRWQVIAATVLVAALVAGLVRLALWHAEPIGTLVNVGWVAFDLISMGILVKAVRYRGFDIDKEDQ